ncbi:MAG: DHH family phosphoesterase [Methanoregula sp.]|nr:DHH family phosphoesterase [Methanoregula sp.]
MSLDAAAETVAEQIRRQPFVEVYAHHDADGIAAGAILCHAMLRAGIRFRLRIKSEVSVAELGGEGAKLLCDLGSGIENLPGDTIVVDHHIPRFEGEFHANPRLYGIDGDRELSAAGMAYIVAQKIGDNRDLAGLVIPGIIGDDQEIKGKNLEIFNDGIGNGIVLPARGLTLPGRDMTERWYIATNPYLSGISGEETVIADLIDEAKGENGTRLDTLISLAVLRAAPQTAVESLYAIYGDTYHLEREVIDDAHALTAVIDACGKSGHGDLGAALCLRSSHALVKAWEIARQHRMNVITALHSVQPIAGSAGVYEVQEALLTSDIADVLARDQVQTMPVIVYARNGEVCRISARCPRGVTADIGLVVREVAAACGGNGGGHNHRAGATIPCNQIPAFVNGWQGALAA